MNLMERFMQHVNKNGMYIERLGSRCWEWTGARNKQQYGMFKVDGRTEKAHRVSWTLFHGPIPEGMFVLHQCDNPPCVNPEHHYLGDNDQNVKDRDERGRTPKGVDHVEAHFTEEQIREIRSKYWPHRISYAKLAKKYGVSEVAIKDIIQRRTYREVK